MSARTGVIGAWRAEYPDRHPPLRTSREFFMAPHVKVRERRDTLIVEAYPPRGARAHFANPSAPGWWRWEIDWLVDKQYRWTDWAEGNGDGMQNDLALIMTSNYGWADAPARRRRRAGGPA